MAWRQAAFSWACVTRRPSASSAPAHEGAPPGAGTRPGGVPFAGLALVLGDLGGDSVGIRDTVGERLPRLVGQTSGFEQVGAKRRRGPVGWIGGVADSRASPAA